MEETATASDLLTLINLAHNLGHDVDWTAFSNDYGNGYQITIREDNGVSYNFYIDFETSATSLLFFDLIRRYSSQQDAKGN